MKRYFFLLIFLFLSINTFSQDLPCFNYQAVLRDTSGVEITGQIVQFKITILQSEYGIPVYSEEHSAITDSVGLFQLSVGCGTPVDGDYSNINWAYAPMFLLCEIDTSGTGNYTIMGFNQLLSVPYALYAHKTGDTSYWKDSDTTDLHNAIHPIGIGTIQVDSSAALEVTSDSLGLLLPRLTTSWRDDIEDPEPGLMIYNYDCECINVYNGLEWVEYGKSENIDFKCGDVYLDERDGQRYPTIEIGPQCWMTRNLEYGMQLIGADSPANNDTIEKYCYDDIPVNCTKYGGLYTWDELMQYDTLVGNQGICPKGWHLPEVYELDTLKNYLDEQSGMGNALKSGGSSGFDALFSGMRDGTDIFSGKDLSGYYWTATQSGLDEANYFAVSSGDNALHTGDTTKMDAFSVRCVKGIPLRLDTGIVVIDTNIYTLMSDSAELAQGIYRYQIIAREEQVINDSNIIVGVTDGGYLRRVLSKTINGQEMVLNTEQASLDDVIISGEFHDEFSIFPDTLDNGGTRLFPFILFPYFWLDDNWDISKVPDGYKLTTNNFPIPLGPIHLLNISGSVIITSKISRDEARSCNSLDDFAFVTNPLHIEADFNVSFDSEIEIEISPPAIPFIEFSIPMPPILIPTPSPPIVIPVISTLDLGLYITTSLKTNGPFNIPHAVQFSKDIYAGIHYKHGEFIPYFDVKDRVTNQFDSPLALKESGNLSYKFSVGVRPEIKWIIYKIGGPSVSYEPTITKSFNIDLETNDWDSKVVFHHNFYVNLVSGKILSYVLKASLIQDELKKVIIENKKYLINTSPYKFIPEMVFGDGQEGYVGEELEKPIELYVSNFLGKPVEDVNVYFDPIEKIPEYKPGIPKFIKTKAEMNPDMVLTGNFGHAKSIWKLDTIPGKQYCEVYFRNAKGDKINSYVFNATAKEYLVPKVTTNNIITTSNSTADCYCTVSDDGGKMVFNKGVCWGYTSMPTLSNFFVACGPGTGDYFGTMTNLLEDTAIYVRGFALNEKGTGFGNQKIFSIGSIAPVVSTDSVIQINQTSAKAFGKVLYDGNSDITAKGFCWSLGSSPTLSDNHTNEGTGNDPFSSNLNNLTPGETYYINAYAINNIDTGYSSTMSIMLNAIVPCPGIETVGYMGTTYNTVLIGNQCWLKENLNVGEMIIVDSISKNNDTIEKYCYQDNEANCSIYGGLYMWDEAMKYAQAAGSQGICPPGWHIPTYDEIDTLIYFCDSVGITLKSTGTYQNGDGLWWEPNTGGTNTSGFSANPSGDFSYGIDWPPYNSGRLYLFTDIWSSTTWEDVPGLYSAAFTLFLFSLETNATISFAYKPWQINPVRCIKILDENL